MVISPAVFSMVDFEPLKSNRVVISRVTPWIAFSTSARSVLETISKLGIFGSGQSGGKGMIEDPGILFIRRDHVQMGHDVLDPFAVARQRQDETMERVQARLRHLVLPDKI